MQKRSRGTTLIEVVLAMAVLAIVSLFAYTGICAGTNLWQHGVDLKDAETVAAESLERSIRQPDTGTADTVTVTVNGAEHAVSVRKITGSDPKDLVSYTYYCAD